MNLTECLSDFESSLQRVKEKDLKEKYTSGKELNLE